MDPQCHDPYSLLIPGFIDVRRMAERDCQDRHMRLYLDGHFLDTIYYGERKLFPVRPGRYTLCATNTLFKKKVEIEIRSGETLYFNCGHRANDMTWFMACLLGTGLLYTFLEAVAAPPGTHEDPIMRELNNPLRTLNDPE